MEVPFPPLLENAMKEFTKADISDPDSKFKRIYADRSELLYDPPEWMKQGLQETASGYGARLNTGLKIHYEGRLYRLYVTIYGNAGSTWFKTKGETIYVD
jgi:hypothetical protein